MSDVAANKVRGIRRAVQRAREELAADPDGFDVNPTRQDAAVLNVLRACEQAIDLANHAILRGELGIPTSSGESFDLLRAAGVIAPELAGRLQKLVGFRNAVMHLYRPIDGQSIRAVIDTGLDDLVRFGDEVSGYLNSAAG